MSENPSVAMPTLAGGSVCLDFANSVDDRGTPRERDFVPDVERFAQWCRHLGLPVRTVAPADVSIAEVHALRDAIGRLVNAAATGTPPPTDALEQLNSYIPQPSLTWTPDGFALALGAPPGSLRSALAILAQDALDLLTGERRAHLRVCDREGHCDWLFLDTTRNHSRRYCTDGCAMTERVLRHKRKTKDAR